jgi:hypothetical protein
MSSEQRGRDTTDTIDTMPETEPTESYSSNVPELTRGNAVKSRGVPGSALSSSMKPCVRRVNGSYNVIQGL